MIWPDQQAGDKPIKTSPEYIHYYHKGFVSQLQVFYNTKGEIFLRKDELIRNIVTFCENEEIDYERSVKELFVLLKEKATLSPVKRDD